MKRFLANSSPVFQQFWVLCGAAIVVVLLYIFALDSGFVLDDMNNIVGNQYIRIKSLTIDSLSTAATKNILPTRPVPYISFALNYFFDEYSVRSFRLVNVLLHIVTGFLLFFFMRVFLDLPIVKKRYGPPGWVPFVAAVIWLVHPIHTQTVNYIVQRMIILAALFYILSFYLYIRGRTAAGKQKKLLFFTGSLIAGLLGLMSKEVVATLPFFIILFEFYFLQDANKSNFKKILIVAAAVLLIGCFFAFFYLGANPVNSIIGTYEARDFTLMERLLTESRVVVFYLSQLFFPHPSRLNLEHDFALSFSVVDPLATLFAILFIAVLLASAVAVRKKLPIISFCIFWYFGNLLIESSFIALEIIFEHRTYLPSMLVIFISVVWFHRAIKPKWLQVAAVTLIVASFSLWTLERNRTWADTITLLTDVVNKSPQKHRPHVNLGINLKNAGRVDEAIVLYKNAMAIKPDYAEAYYNLGNALTLKGDYRGATDNFFKALQYTPHDVDTHYNLGYTLSKLWRFEEAEYHYREAIRLNPHFTKARQELTELKQYVRKLYSKKPPAK
jgi:hypothetical protein